MGSGAKAEHLAAVERQVDVADVRPAGGVARAEVDAVAIVEAPDDGQRGVGADPGCLAPARR